MVDVPTTQQFDALAARVTALEEGQPVPPDPPDPPDPNPTPSPSGTYITDTAGKITDSKLRKRTLMQGSAADGLQIATNDAVDTRTRNVAGLLFFEGIISQTNTAGNWYAESATDTWSQIPGDPRVPVAPVVPGSIVFNPGTQRPGVGRDGNIVTCDLTKTTAGRLNKAVFSAAGASMAPSAPWDYRFLVDPNAVAAFKRLGLSFVRILGGTSMGDLFGANGTDTPDWRKLDNLLHLKEAFPGATYMLCLCYAWNLYDWNNTSLCARLAANYATVARHLEAGGLHVTYWEPLNEPDGHGTGAQAVAAFEKQVRDALHGVDPNYIVGGPTTTYERGDYVTPSAAAGAQFICWHAYHHSPGQYPPDQTCWDDGVNWGDQPTNAQTQARQGHPGNYPTFLTEYYLNLYSGDGNDTRQQQWQGAVFAGCVMLSEAYGGLCGSTIWRLENNDGTYGVFQTGTWNLNPVGTLITELNRRMPAGPMMQCTVKSTTTDRLLALGSTDDTKFGLALVNYHTSQNWQGQVALPGRASTVALDRWRLDSGTPLGAASKLEVGSMATVSIPAGSVMVLSGPK